MSEKSLEEELVEVPKPELVRVLSFGPAEIGRLAAIESRQVDHQAFVALLPSSPSFGYFINMRASSPAASTGELGLMVTKATQKLKEV